MNFHKDELVLDLTNISSWNEMYSEKTELFYNDVLLRVRFADPDGFSLKRRIPHSNFSSDFLNIAVFEQNGFCEINPDIVLYNASLDPLDFYSKVLDDIDKFKQSSRDNDLMDFIRKHMESIQKNYFELF